MIGRRASVSTMPSQFAHTLHVHAFVGELYAALCSAVTSSMHALILIVDRIYSETTWKSNQGKYMFLELHVLGIDSLQIRVTTKDSEY